ncbi:hypothetical protein CYMTET_33318 [Cymbomonas tetramitiformis]|uniref:EF-hand domain-containing protein n=1 Tax=Cymbomonas tetramitiformis TaxID=36881 RepID=A0AAE0FD93_9CHLO|nr:hypothetical protein CYMTET_33318 [Cymbomonas tetramitiformis]
MEFVPASEQLMRYSFTAPSRMEGISEKFLDKAREEVESQTADRYMRAMTEFSTSVRGCVVDIWASPGQLCEFLREEAMAHLPEFEDIFSFWRKCIKRFPKRCAIQKSSAGKKVTDRYRIAVNELAVRIKERMAASRPDNAKKWLLETLDAFENPQMHSVDSIMAGSDFTSLSPVELQEKLAEIFKVFDVDVNGYIDRPEFNNVLRSSLLKKIDKSTMTNLMAEADMDHDGKISFKEFLPLMVDILSTSHLHERAMYDQKLLEEECYNQASDYLLHGVPASQLKRILETLFQEYDTDNSGDLDSEEVFKALRDARLGFTRREMNVLMSSMDIDGDGKLHYNEFLPMMENLLLENLKNEFVANKALHSENAIAKHLQELLLAKDPGDKGYLPLSVIKSVLMDNYQEHHVSMLQILSILSTAPVDDYMMVEYSRFVPLASEMLHSMIDLRKLKIRMDAAIKLSKSVGSGVSEEESFEGNILESFRSCDKDGTGYLCADEFTQCLQKISESSSSLSRQDATAVIAAVDADSEGRICYPKSS